MDLPRISGADLQEVARVKKSTAGRLDGWAWNEIKALPLPWLSGLLSFWRWLKTLASGLRVYWMLKLP